MNLQEFLSTIPVISKERDYWFIRTQGGKYFDSFIENDFIGIGWNKISLEDLIKKDSSKVLQKISNGYDINRSTKEGKKESSTIYNKLMRFVNFREGDVVIVPSRESSRWGFGIIVDKRPFVDNDRTGNCDYVKRRMVSWQKVVNFNELDPIFNQIKTVQHSLSNINTYANYIDIVTKSFYYKGDSAHLVLNVKTHEAINAKEFFNLGNSLIHVLEIIKREYQLDEEIDETSLRLYLQSPGSVELLSLSKKKLMILSLLLMPLVVSKTNSVPQVSDPKLNKIKSEAKNELDTIQDSMTRMKIKSFEEIDDIYGK